MTQYDNRPICANPRPCHTPCPQERRALQALVLRILSSRLLLQGTPSRKFLFLLRRQTAAPSERAEAQLPQPGSAAAVTEFPAGVAVAATKAVAAAVVPSDAPPYGGQITRQPQLGAAEPGEMPEKKKRRATKNSKKPGRQRNNK
jgi:hypothetical protein